MLIAVTSKDGREINQHFGHAERFLLYEVNGGIASLAGEVKADAYCNWSSTLRDTPPAQFDGVVGEMRECADAPPPHRMMPEKLAAIANTLGDCRIVVTAMIGEAPLAELERLGFTVYAVTGAIGTVLPEIARLH